MRLELGTPVHCTDGAYGELADVVVDPISKRVTHVVVRPTGQEAEETRLVPVQLVESGGEPSELSLRATVAEVNGLEPVREYAYRRLGESAVSDPDWDVGIQDVLAAPYYEADFGQGLGAFPGYGPELGLIYDRVPKGEVEIRRSSDVFSADEHHLGEVDWMLVDDEGHITHLILERGHLWGRQEVTIPIGGVAKVETDVVTLSLTKDQVGELPSIRVRRH